MSRKRPWPGSRRPFPRNYSLERTDDTLMYRTMPRLSRHCLRFGRYLRPFVHDTTVHCDNQCLTLEHVTHYLIAAGCRVSRCVIELDPSFGMQIMTLQLLNVSCICNIPQGRLAFASLWGLANPCSRSQGDRRDKRPAYVSPYVLRREGRRECKAFNYGYILSTWPWVVAHPRS